jgi:hypothetical protein
MGASASGQVLVGALVLNFGLNRSRRKTSLAEEELSPVKVLVLKGRITEN